jgi:hypothetical protein
MGLLSGLLRPLDDYAAGFASVRRRDGAASFQLVEVAVALSGAFEALWAVAVGCLFGIESQMALPAAQRALSRRQKLEIGVVALRHEESVEAEASPAFW